MGAATVEREKRRKPKARKGPKRNPMCGATKPNGTPCKQVAGAGTDHLGQGRCARHESEAGFVEVARRQGLGAAGAVGSPVPVNPHQAILGVLRLAAGELAYVNSQVRGLDDVWTEGGSRSAWLKWQAECEERVARFAQMAVAMGVAQRQVELAEQQTQAIVGIIEAIADRLDLSPGQRKKLGPALREVVVDSTAVDLGEA